MKNCTLILLILQIFIMSSCGIFEPEQNFAKDYFPLRVGETFVYKLVMDNAVENINRSGYKDTVEVKNIGVKYFSKTKYFMILNYHINPYCKDTVFVRRTNNNVYFFGNKKENLHYSFNPDKSVSNYASYYKTSNSDSDVYISRDIKDDIYYFKYEVGREYEVTEIFYKNVGRKEIHFAYYTLGYFHYELINKY